MVSYILGLVSGLAAAFIGAFFEPVKRWVAKLGRTVVEDTGLQMHVELDPSVIWAGMPPWISSSYFIPGTEELDTPPSDSTPIRQWVYAPGGCDAVTSIARVTLTGTSSSVVIETPRVTAWDEPLPAGEQITYLAAGASITPRAFDVNLDYHGISNPIVTLHDEGGDGDVLRLPLSFSLREGEVEQFMICVNYGARVLIHWQADIPVLIDGKRRFLQVSDAGAPITFAGGRWDAGRRWDGSAWV